MVREQQIPFLGICFGMQLAVIESARNLGHMPLATSSEFSPDGTQVITLVTQKETLGGTTRLGAASVQLKPGTLAYDIYGTPVTSERQRHRYGVNASHVRSLEKTGLVFSGHGAQTHLPEIIERPEHPWFIGVQFHPHPGPFNPILCLHPSSKLPSNRSSQTHHAAKS